MQYRHQTIRIMLTCPECGAPAIATTVFTKSGAYLTEFECGTEVGHDGTVVVFKCAIEAQSQEVIP